MRRLLSVAFLSASLAVLPSAFGQHAGPGGGFSGEHAGGFAGHVGGGFSGGGFGRSYGFAPRSYSAPNFVSTAPSNAVSTAAGRAFSPGYRFPVGATPAWQHDGGDRYGDRGGRYRSPYRGYGYGYPAVYANSWELLPWDLGYPDYTGYGDYDSGQEPQQQANTSVVAPDEGYRPDYDGSAEPPYAYPPAPPADAYAQPAPSPVAPEPGLTLIFNDGHQETIHNYVLTADAVVDLDDAASGRQRRIPLASLNLDATEQAAQQAGLDFTPPA